MVEFCVSENFRGNGHTPNIWKLRQRLLINELLEMAMQGLAFSHPSQGNPNTHMLFCQWLCWPFAVTS